MFARPFIDSVDFARNGREMRGEIAVSELSRLADMLARSEGSLLYIVRGYHEDDRDMLELFLQGACILRCQRCLGELEYPVDIVSRLRLLPADRLDEAEVDDDEMDAIEAEVRLDVTALIEEELLLCLPFAPMHSEGECVPATSDLQQKASPFAVLAGLKK
ncbi:MAG: YceD family protein [Gallionellaceae bacterium]|nr:YceD family protein [Gallionellaceae bacterium]